MLFSGNALTMGGKGAAFSAHYLTKESFFCGTRILGDALLVHTLGLRELEDRGC